MTDPTPKPPMDYVVTDARWDAMRKAAGAGICNTPAPDPERKLTRLALLVKWAKDHKLRPKVGIESKVKYVRIDGKKVEEVERTVTAGVKGIF